MCICVCVCVCFYLYKLVSRNLKILDKELKKKRIKSRKRK